MRIPNLCLAALLLASPALGQGASPPSIDGLWDAVVTAGAADASFAVPFRFEIATKGATAEGFFFEGDRKIGSTSGAFAGDTLKLKQLTSEPDGYADA